MSMRNNQSTIGWGFRKENSWSCAISSSFIPNIEMTTTTQGLRNLVPLKNLAGLEQIRFWGQRSRDYSSEFIRTTTSIDVNDPANSSSTRLEQSLLWVNHPYFLIDVFKIDLIYYMDMFLSSMCDLSIIHAVIALGINLFLKVCNYLTI